MLKWLRKWVRNYFGFSKTETNGFIILIPLMIIFLSAPGVYSKIFSRGYTHYEADKALLDSIMSIWNEHATYQGGQLKIQVATVEMPIKLRAFEPNTASKDLLMSVGIPQFLAQRILNYRNKNGRFRIKDDLGGIYDFPDSLLQQLKPYISLPEKLPSKKVDQMQGIESSTVVEKSFTGRIEKKGLETIDINNADTLLFKSLRGIGPVYAKRIVKYRNMLGGFVGVDQMAEVYGLTDSLLFTFQDRLAIDTAFQPKQININLATFKELNAHPYISYRQAGDLLNAKSKNGKFRGQSDLNRVASFSKPEIEKLIPYLSFR